MASSRRLALERDIDRNFDVDRSGPSLGQRLGQAAFAGFLGAQQQDPFAFQKFQQNQLNNRLRGLQIGGEQQRQGLAQQQQQFNILQDQQKIDLAQQKQTLAASKEQRAELAAMKGIVTETLM